MGVSSWLMRSCSPWPPSLLRLGLGRASARASSPYKPTGLLYTLERGCKKLFGKKIILLIRGFYLCYQIGISIVLCCLNLDWNRDISLVSIVLGTPVRLETWTTYFYLMYCFRSRHQQTGWSVGLKDIKMNFLKEDPLNLLFDLVCL